MSGYVAKYALCNNIQKVSATENNQVYCAVQGLVVNLFTKSKAVIDMKMSVKRNQGCVLSSCHIARFYTSLSWK